MKGKSIKQKISYILAVAMLVGCIPGFGNTYTYAQEIKEGGASRLRTTSDPVIVDIEGEVTTASILTVEEAQALKEKMPKEDKHAVIKDQVVEGYIVGYMEGKKFEPTFSNRPNLKGSKNEVSNSNIAIATSKDETNTKHIMPIQLKSKKIRKEASLKDNPSYLGAKVRITGGLGTYFTVAGIRDASNIEVIEQAAQKLEVKAIPGTDSTVIVGDKINLQCTNVSATIYYETDCSKGFKLYKDPISTDVVGDLMVTAYAEVEGTDEKSETVTFKYKVKNLNEVSIKEIREQQPGNVTFKGVVTRQTDQGIYVQDDTAGIYIYRGKANEALKPGDEVKVQGELTDFNKLVQIKDGTVIKLGGSKAITPQIITIADFMANKGEYESELIQFNNVKMGDLIPSKGTTIKEGKEETVIYKAPADIAIGFDTYSVIALGSIHGDKLQLTVAAAEDVTPQSGIQKLSDIILKQGEALVLPKTVLAIEEGKTIDKAIAWNKEAIDKVDINEIGKYLVDGMIEGNIPVKITINVITSGTITIADIQGSSHTSVFVGQPVKDIEGVVTALDKTYGFYMQMAIADGDDKTSDGIYVSKKDHNVEVGDTVKVTGIVDESIGYTTNPFTDKGIQLKITEIKKATIQKGDKAKEIPAPIIIGAGGRMTPNEIIDNDGFSEFDPEEDAIDFYESLEGMRVEIVDAQVVGPNKYDEVFVVPNKGKCSKGALTPQGGVVLTEGNFHPERMILAKGNQKLPKDVMIGDVFNGSVIGTMSYNDGNFKVLLSEPLPSITEHSYDENPITTLTETENGLRIGSFNVENLGGNAKQKKVDDIAKVIVENMKLPDIIGLQEIQDNNGAPKVGTNEKVKLDGVVDASTTYNNLIEAINDAQKGDHKVTYAYTEVSPEDGKDGGQPGGNIRVGALYRTDRVELAKAKAGDATTAVEVLKDSDDGSAKLSLNPGRIAPQDPAFKGSRKSLVVEFVFKGQKVFLIGNHLKSKRGDDAAFGNKQPVEEHSAVARMEQVKVLNAFVKDILAVDAKAKIVLLGDLNDFQFSKTVNTLEGNELYNMIEKLPENERYSYSYQGNSQTLDNVLVTKGLEDNTEIDILNMNSCKPKGVQISDHDPIVIAIDMEGANQPDQPVEESVKISEIQGKSHRSPFENKKVKAVEGVVTELNGKHGFYMQSLVEDADEDTSEGIYVESNNPNVKVGNIVKVSGLVDEDAVQTGKKKNDVKLEITQIKADAIVVIENVTELPQPILVGEGGRVVPNQIIDNDGFSVFDPKEDAIDFYESLESMRVEIRNAQVVGGTNYYEIPVIPDRGKHSLNGLTPQGGVVITKDNLHPEKILLARGSEKVSAHAMVGDVFEGSIIGVIGYSYDNYKLLLSSKLPKATLHNYDENPKTTLKETKNGLRVAAFNVENLGGDAEQEKINNIAKVIVDNFKLPDIISLEEIQDNSGKKDDGVVAADKVYNRLLEAIESVQQDKDKVKYEYVEIAPEDKKDGGQPGGNIRVGMLYRKDRVQLAQGKAGDATTDVKVIKNTNGKPSLSLNPGRIATADPAFANTRKPLVAEFIFNGQKVFVIGNHLSSKRGDDAPFGNIQPPIQHSAVARMEQVKILNAFVKAILALDSKANIVVLGDMNDFEFSDTVNTLEGNELYNMIEKLPENERYTYNYQGNSQVLDNVLVTKGLEGKTEIDILNMNSCKPGRIQLSDHDPIIIRMEIKKPSSGGSSSSSEVSSTPVTPQPEVVIKSDGETTQISVAENFITDKVKESKDQVIVFEPKIEDNKAQNVQVDLEAKLVANLNELKKDLAIKTEDLTIKLPHGFASDNESITVASKEIDITKDKIIKTMPKELMALGGYKLEVKVAGNTKDAFVKGIQVEVEVPKAVKDEGKLVAYVLQDGKWKYVPSKVVESKLVATIKVSGEIVVAESTKTFRDIQKHWAQRDIEILAAKQLIVGTGKDHFDPTAKLTRQDFGTVLARLFESEKGINFKNSEKDITRAQMAVMIQEAMEANGIKQDKVANTNLSQFKDAKELTLEEQQALAYMVELGVLKGTSSNTISPDTILTRAEMSAVIIRLEKLNK